MKVMSIMTDLMIYYDLLVYLIFK